MSKARRRLTVQYRLLVILYALFAFLFSGPIARAQDGGKLKIGFSIEAMNGERWQTDLNSFEARAKQLGAEVISADANGDDERQLKQVKDMIQSGIKVLVLMPHDSSMANRMVEAAKAAHVKVISYDRLVPNSEVDLYVSFDRVEIGWMQAEYLVKHAPTGNYVVVSGAPGREDSKTLHDAQMSVLRPYMDRGDIKVIAEAYTKDWLALASLGSVPFYAQDD